MNEKSNDTLIKEMKRHIEEYKMSIKWCEERIQQEKADIAILENEINSLVQIIIKLKQSK